MAVMTEEWRAVPGYEHYEVSTLGRVRSPRCVLSSWRAGIGYRQVTLCRDAQRKRFTVHRLVLLTFVGPPADGQVCRHLDGNPANNALPNLAWGSTSENMQDQVRHGTHRRAAATECPHGHPYNEANTYRVPSNWRRQCIACRADRNHGRTRGALREWAQANGISLNPLGRIPIAVLAEWQQQVESEVAE